MKNEKWLMLNEKRTMNNAKHRMLNEKWLMKNDQKVAIVHDWLIGGGAERVVEALHNIYPDAPIYTSYCTDEWRNKLDGKVVTGYLQHRPFGALRKYLPVLRALWFSHLDLRHFDLVISSSGAEAKFVKKLKPGAKHVAYIHAPTHYYWLRYNDYLKKPGFPTGFNWLAKLGLQLLVGPMRRWDYKAAQRPDMLIANSTYTQSEIKKYYGRQSSVVFPPVAVERFSTQSKATAQRQGFVIAGRQTPYKRFDLAVQACTKLNLPLTVIGNGPDHQKLVSMAGPSVSFVTQVANQQMPDYFQSAQAFIFPGLDDFGIVAVEALASGTPVIAYKDGGALDYVNDKTGIFFAEQTVDSLADALQAFDPKQFTSTQISLSAKTYNKESFVKNFTQLVN